MSENAAALPAADDAPPKKRVPRKGLDAAVRIVEMSKNPGPLATFVTGKHDQRALLLDGATKAVEAAERDLAQVKAHRAELEAMATAIDGLGGAALTGLASIIEARLK